MWTMFDKVGERIFLHFFFLDFVIFFFIPCNKCFFLYYGNSYS